MIWGWIAPITKMTMSTIPETRAAGCRSSRGHSRVADLRGRTDRAAGTVCASTLAISVRPRTRVEHPQHDLAEDRDHDHQAAGEEQREHQGVRVDRDESVGIELERVDEERPDPAQLEDEVDRERRAEDQPEVGHDRGDERGQCVPHRVAEHHDPLREALGPRDRDIRARQERRGARSAGSGTASR